MSKRTAEEEEAAIALKAGSRPQPTANGDEASALDFEDEFEDEYESEDEILEAGVDGRPDAEREAEQKGTYMRGAAGLVFSASNLTIDALAKLKQIRRCHGHRFSFSSNRLFNIHPWPLNPTSRPDPHPRPIYVRNASHSINPLALPFLLYNTRHSWLETNVLPPNTLRCRRHASQQLSRQRQRIDGSSPQQPIKNGKARQYNR